MDPLTHTLVGLSLVGTRLGRVSRFAPAALVIGANLPDLDVLSYVEGSDAALGFRRGWTHGVPALIVLPLVLAATLWLLGRWLPARRGSPEPSLGVLGGLSYLAVWSHPALDWLNTYGMRWWMPFDGRWSYGDSVFIVDPWLWLTLGLGWLLGRERSVRLGLGVVALTAPLLVLVAVRAPRFLPLTAAVLGLLWLAAWVRRPSGERWRDALPIAGLLAGAAYVGALLLVQNAAESRVRERLAERAIEVRDLMVGPMPADPSRWDVVVDSGSHYRFGTFDWRGPTLALSSDRLPAARGSRAWRRVAAAGAVPGFRRWTRFPWTEDPNGTPATIYLMDARYARQRTTGFGGAEIELPVGD